MCPGGCGGHETPVRAARHATPVSRGADPVRGPTSTTPLGRGSGGGGGCGRHPAGGPGWNPLLRGRRGTGRDATSRDEGAVWRSGVPSWKGRGPSAVDSTPPGAVPKYPDPGQQGNDLSRSRGDWIRSGAGLFPSGFPSPPTTCLEFSLWSDSSVWRFWGGYFGHKRSGWGGVYEEWGRRPRRRLIKPTVLWTTIPPWAFP